MLKKSLHQSEELVSDEQLFEAANPTLLAFGIILGRISQQEPTQETLRALRAVTQDFEAELSLDELPLSRKQKARVAEIRNSLYEFLGDYDDDSQPDSADSQVEVLRSDYMRLMVGVGDPLAAPWESVYLSKERSIFQVSTLDVRRWFHNYGLQSVLEYREPDDHIGTIVEFVCAVLSGRLASATPSESDESQACMALFMQEHLASWVETWNDCIQQHARTSYYKALGWEIVAIVWYLRSLLKG